MATLLALAVLSGGCWDYQDANERISVLGMGVDLGPQGEHIPTLEVSTLGVLRSDGQLQEDQRFTGSGFTSTTVFHRLRRTSSRPLDFGHVNVLIIGQDYAKRGIRDEVGCAGCHPEMPTATLFAVTTGRAEEALKTPAPIDTYTSLWLVGVFEDARTGGFIPPTDTIAKFVAEMARGRPVAVPRITNKPILEMSGGAVFQGFRLVGWIDENEAKGLNILKGEGNHMMLAVPCVVSGREAGGERYSSALLMANKSSVNVIEQGEDPGFSFLYEITTGASMIDSGCKQDAWVYKKQMEEMIARQVRILTAQAIRRAKSMRVDFLGLGDVLQRERPSLWADTDWTSVFPGVPITVRIKVNLDRNSRFHGMYRHERRILSR